MNRLQTARRQSGIIRLLTLLTIAALIVLPSAHAQWARGESGALREAGLEQVLEMTRISRQVREDVEHLIRDAAYQTSGYAQDTNVIETLAKGEAGALRELANILMRSSQVIDVIAFFDRKGTLRAMNSLDRFGYEFSEEKIEQIMGKEFTERGIIADCLTNETSGAVLEFQTHCDFTPILFGSNGLSVAFSDAVADSSGDKIGVVSTRLNFGRILDIIRSKRPSGAGFSVFFVGAEGEYFDEEINAGLSEGPIGKAQLLDYLQAFQKRDIRNIFVNGDGFHAQIMRMQFALTGQRAPLYLLSYFELDVN